ncbi:hypothetical protein [Photobacterium damselae]|uniref:Lipoprotein n=1 Tax=Photobacterium damselae TaxID=38293 RepID=A0ABD6WZL5_PHODM|nr:hypothetical protein [Photobacterium damselae]OBU38824.1 hypothetical protein AYY27_11710 [Photobacterium damselae]PSU15086.1 hypothetical protein CTM90_18300 [Photobacterium damselae]
MKTKIITLLAASLLTACASAPEDISASYVSPQKYDNYDCTQISAEMDNVSRRAQSLYNSLDSKATGDVVQSTVGILLFFPTLFFLEGGDGPEATEYAQLQGEKVALEKASVAKKCSLSFKS